MTLQWIRFGFTALFVLLGVFFFVSAALGANKPGFDLVLQRMHAASMGDTLGLFFIAAGVLCAMGVNLTTLKAVLVVFIMWCTSPVSGHLLAKIEYYTSEKAGKDQ